MANVTPRWLWNNLAAAAATTLSPSSGQTANPIRWLRDQLRTKTWRSAVGWTIITGANDKLDFNRAGVKVATIAAGTYATGAALCTAIVAALEAADAPPVWAASYDTAAKKFTISSDIAFVLLFGSGANVITSTARDLGFASADTGSATSQLAGNTSYQSRHYIVFDLGSALAVTSAAITDHNSGTGGVWSVAGNSSNAFGAPAFADTPIAGTARERVLYFATQTLRYWRILVTDVQNPAGYAELGVAFLGTYFEPLRGPAPGLGRMRNEFTIVAVSEYGSTFQDEKPSGRGFDFATQMFTDAERLNYMTMLDTLRVGRAFFFAFDPLNAAAEILYGYLSDPVAFGHAASTPAQWSAAVRIHEAL